MEAAGIVLRQEGRVRIDIIDNEADFVALRENWYEVFMADPEGQHYLSWGWMRNYLFRRKRWFVLALREASPGSPYVAFLPLRVLTPYDEASATFSDEIVMGGNHSADYTGFIARPEHEKSAIYGFAAFLKKQNWTHLRLDYFAGSAKRRAAFIRALEMPDVMHRDSTPKNSDNIDNCICPYIPLPGSWDEYLATRMSGQTRQKLRRFLRMVEVDDAYSITFATKETIGRHLDVLFEFWYAKWVARKGEERTKRLIVATREMLMDCFNDGTLEVPMLSYGGKPLAVLANILDRDKKTVFFYITGRDESWTTPSPGLILHATCIRRAIEDGFLIYDFLRGNEKYKYAFGTDERQISCVLFRTRNGKNLGGVLHPRSIRYVYERGIQFYRDGAKSRAQAAFLQVQASAPDHLGACFGLANLDFDRGRLAEAESAYLKIASASNSPVPVLLRLGDTQLALRKFDAASDTFLRVINNMPHNSQAHYKRGVALVAAQRLAEARKAFDQLKAYHTDDPEHARYLQKAEIALAKMSPATAIKGKKVATRDKPYLSPVSEIVLAMAPSIKGGGKKSPTLLRRLS